MQHLHDDDGYPPPLKVLRKRLNGVYREDLGFSGPTRRYVLMVALLVGLASVPTLAVITTGSNEMSVRERPGAMDVPFLPPPAAGPVRPTPSVTPLPPDASDNDQPGGTKKDGGPADSRPGVGKTSKRANRSSGVFDRPVVPARRPKAGADRSWVPGRLSAPAQPAKSDRPRKPNRPGAPDRPSVPGRPGKPDRPSVPERPGKPDRPHVPGVPVVPDLPVVPEENDVSRPDVPAELPSIPDLPEVPADPGPLHRGARDRDKHDNPDKPGHHRHRPCENATVQENWSRRRGDVSVHHPPSRRSAVTERPHNIRAARILEQSYAGTGNVRRSMSDSRPEDFRAANRPYRGQHRAEHTNHSGEHAAAWQRSTRVGRHHADPHGEHHTNHR